MCLIVDAKTIALGLIRSVDELTAKSNIELTEIYNKAATAICAENALDTKCIENSFATFYDKIKKPKTLK